MALNVAIATLSLVEQTHFRLHLNAVIKDAADIKDAKERQRVLAEANDMLTGKVVIPTDEPYMVHDWIEQPKTRMVITNG